ncbi:MAG: hypothetical protein M1834_007914 [Cirrosporium novae-zelandiae]|nr:MAG: hypothetical protein M1834_007914 [Cirrosporium novae-zelandiae]
MSGLHNGLQRPIMSFTNPLQRAFPVAHRDALDPREGELNSTVSNYDRENNGLRRGTSLDYGQLGRPNPRELATASRKKYNPTKAGGFLLESSFASAGRTNADLRPRHSEEYHRNVQKIEDGDLTVHKQRSKPTTRSKLESLGIPLSAAGASGLEKPSRKSYERSRSSPSRQPAPVPHSDIEPRPMSTNFEKSQRPVGLDVDPAQIVSLALNLSESRKRSFGGVRFASIDAGGGRRVYSTSPSSSPVIRDGFQPGPGGSLKQSLMQQRRISRNISPLGDKLNRRNALSPNIPIHIPSALGTSTNSPDLDHGPEFFSEATLARAEKAKAFFVDFYAYLQLLEHLPPLRSAAKGSSRPKTRGGESEGRVYNPLQYIRNRKVRYRERDVLNSEADGWNDPTAVQGWIEHTISKIGPPSNDPCECLELPPLRENLDEDSDQMDTDPLMQPLSRPPTALSVPKPRRPRNDWITSPADFLADAFWLEQDSHKRLIEDRDSNKLYPPEVPLYFKNLSDKIPTERKPVGLGVGTPHIPSMIQEESMEFPEPVGGRLSLQLDDGNGIRQSAKLRDSLQSLQRSSGSADTKPTWRGKLARSRSISSASDSEDGGSFKHKKKQYQSLMATHDRSEFGTAALEKRMLELLEKERETAEPQERMTIDRIISETISANNLPQNLERKESSGSEHHLMKTKSPRQSLDVSRHNTVKHRLKHIEDDSKHRPSLEGGDTTAPSSPVTLSHIPGIAINLSPPHSPPRTQRITPERKISNLNIGPPQHEKKKAAEGVNMSDFPIDNVASREISRRASLDVPSEAPGNFRTSFSSRREKAKFDPTLSSLYRMNSPPPRKKGKSRSTSKLRGIFKGGRIAEMVSHEVSKVGDYIWKRDVPQTGDTTMISPAASVHTDDSDLDNTGLPRKSMSKEISRTSSKSIDDPSLSKKATTAEPAPKYHMKHLPSFRSSAKKGDSKLQPIPTRNQSVKRANVDEDNRGRSKPSTRLDLPKLDIRSASPSPARIPKLIETGASTPDYRSNLRNQVSTDDSKLNMAIAEAHRKSNRIQGGPLNPSSLQPPSRLSMTTGLAAFDPVARKPENRSSMTDISNKSQPSTKSNSVIISNIVPQQIRPVSRRDAARVRALLLTSGIKAAQVVRMATSVSDEPPPFLKQSNAAPLSPVPRFQEHKLAASIVLSDIDETNQKVHDAIEQFRREALSSLLDQCRELDGRISEGLSPRVRALADEAGAFTTELTTTRTLAVKQLNDGIELMSRRRRRRLRWVRRAGFVLLEWVVLGIMWWVWMVVMMVKMMRGVKRGVVGVVKWALWL